MGLTTTWSSRSTSPSSRHGLGRSSGVIAHTVVPFCVMAPVELDEAGHTATVARVPIELTAKEFALLRYFLLHPGEVISAEQLLEHVWDEHADPFTNTVRVTLSNLRRKLTTAGSGELIDTIVGAGYRLVPDG